MVARPQILGVECSILGSEPLNEITGLAIVKVVWWLL